MSATRTSLVGTYTVVKRAQSSGSSTTSGKDAKCTGSKSSCERPSNTNAVTVGVAVAIPVGCVLILFVVILWVVYRRNKKEAQEDNDPEFEGDTEYLPAAKGAKGYSLSSSSGSGDSRTPREWVGDEESYFGNPGRYVRGNESARDSQARNLNPFFLPEGNDDSLRDFARQLQNDELGPYRIASNSHSRVTSQLSLPLEKNAVKVSPDVGSSTTAYTSGNANDTLSDATPAGDLRSSSEPPLNQSPVKSAAGDVTRKFAEDHSGLEAEHSKLDSLDNQNSHTRAAEIFHDDFDFDAREPQNRLDDPVSGEVRDDDHVITLSAKEEEDIRRMKSVYKVYLDRNGTMKQQPVDEQELEDYEEQEAIAQSSNISETDAGTHLRVASDSHRVASSIYSAPPPQSYPVQESQVNAEYYMDHNSTSQQYSNQPQNVAPYGYVQPYAQSYEQQQQYPPQHYPMHFPQHQYAHPQTLETIGELPTPTNLPFSTSSHSLTSFKQKSKQPQIAQLQAARINGTAVNPMDHPEMFYAHGNDSYASYQTANGSVVSQPAAPYQLRQSVVMTNPADLTPAPRFRPAGSIRTASAANTRNNTMTSRMNPYYQQQQAYNSRVSGLLNEADVTQPPSVGQILPHSGSNEDVRRQIGTSHNYNVV